MIQIQPPLPFPSPPRLLLANEFYSKLISYGIARIRKIASNVVNFFLFIPLSASNNSKSIRES